MRKLPLIPTLITFIALVILLKLSAWQFARAQEKQTLMEQDLASNQQVYGDLLTALAAPGNNNFKRLMLSGVVDSEHLFYWDNRVLQGRVGYEIIAPVKTAAGDILVNFGWHADTDFRRTLPQINLPERVQQLRVVLYLPGLNNLIQQSESQGNWPALIQQPDIRLMGQWLSRDFIPAMGYVEPTEQFALENNYRPVTLSPEKHIAYAIQWLLLAIACILVFILALRKKWKDERQQQIE